MIYFFDWLYLNFDIVVYITLLICFFADKIYKFFDFTFHSLYSVLT